MSLVDTFIEVILYARNFSRIANNESPTYDVVREEFIRLFELGMKAANECGYQKDIYLAAKQAVVAYVDEQIQCSSWGYKNRWKKEPLQRLYFDTTNLGDKFYDILNGLNKFGPDREVREVYSLCLGLGFKGKFFNSADLQKYEEVKGFNLGLLLNDEAQKNIDSTRLFPMAYGSSGKRVSGNYKPRLNILPYTIITPVVLVMLVALYQRESINELLNSIASIVN